MKNFLKVVLLLLTLSLMVSCDKDTEKNQKTQLVIYSSVQEVLSKEVIKGFNKKYPNIEVIAPKWGSSTVINKLLLESENDTVGADLVWIADPLSLTPFIKKGVFESYTSPEIKALKARYKDPENYWFATRVVRASLIYNTNLVHEKPTSWWDLTDPKYAGKVAIAGIPGAITYRWGATLIENKDFTLNYIKKIRENGGKATRNHAALLSKIASGELAMGVTSADGIKTLKATGASVDLAYPKEGVIDLISSISLVKSSKKKDAAKKFINFVLSKEGQEIMVKNHQISVIDSLNSEKAPKILSLTKDYYINHQEEVRKKVQSVFSK